MLSVKSVLDLLIFQAQEKKTSDIRVYDLEGASAVTDWMVLMTVSNKIHCKSLQQSLEEVVEKLFEKDGVPDDFYDRPRVSGHPDSEWVVLDFNAIVVHILTEDIRLHYELDRLYADFSVVYYH